MARTILDDVLGLRPDFIEHQLANAVRNRTGAYNRTAHLPERHRMMQAWVDYLDKLTADGAQGKFVKVVADFLAAETYSTPRLFLIAGVY